MRLADDGTIGLSPSDLSAHLACPHLTSLNLRVRAASSSGRTWTRHAWRPDPPQGDEHEAAYLARLEAEGRSIVRIPTYDDEGFDPDEARRLTEEAIRAGEADVIYQPYLTDGRWRGFADFLERQPDGTYEPVDTKLARSAKPAHVLQLCFYSEQVARIQGAPASASTSSTGAASARRSASPSTRRTTVACASGSSARSSAEPETYPWPCDHCGICDFRQAVPSSSSTTTTTSISSRGCDAVGRAADRTGASGRSRRSASLPAGPRRGGCGNGRRDAAGDARDDPQPGRAAAPRPRHRRAVLRAPARPGGARLPAPASARPATSGSTSRGIRSTRPRAGSSTCSAGATATRPARSSTRRSGRATATASARAFEQFVDWVVERRRRHPGMHVYHYAAYERTALTRLMGEHGTREQEVDDVPAPRGARRPLPRRQAGAPGLGRRATRSRRSRSSTGSSAPRRSRAATSRSSASRSGSRQGTTACSTTSSATTRRTAARPSSCTSGSSSCGLRTMPWRPPPELRQRSEAAKSARRAGGARDALLEGAEEGTPRRLLASARRLPPARAAAGWWAWFRWPQLDDQELVEDRTAIGGLDAGSGDLPRSRTRATRTG